ncbi:SprT-like domain-containing protein [Comamonas sp.]|uniref:SprT-like domain-containing protein n=1 Tax=Comamonas sp. TaxID=34028 RepID=UPI0025829C92|nr:SprT-like domain-containing protein [Comamonas sp.]
MIATNLHGSVAPTRETYEELQVAYDHFNEQLFGGTLPSCLITLQREKRTFGYFSPARFASLTGTTTDEIALNPTYFAVVPIVETLQTLAHEMVHLWQEHLGKPGRGRYHNDEWASKMESIGLMPSSTGQPGGKRTGDMMADYAITGGRFLGACEALLTGSFKLSWYDRFPSEEHVRIGAQSQATRIEGIQGTTVPMSSNQALASAIRPGGNVRNPAALQTSGTESGHIQSPNNSNRIKYTCGGCKSISVWGKPRISLICGVCKSAFIST